ncbi:CIC11C00000000851 [Sungouiella intermedia]|uniref:CIC11C00000000851 n=1 Tax=Sungouiella intermedia TaxID=45354 RepID=A0A1L0C2Y9_9ASCO|nr:CIC11C00000000851 [[Candida] intermedia]
MTLTHSIGNDGTHVLYLSVSGKYLLVNGSTIEVVDEIPLAYSKETATPVSCVLGTIKLKINKYLILADRHEITGSIMGKHIAKVSSFKIYTLGNDSISKKDAEEGQYLSLLNQHLTNATLFYSVDNAYDLTNSLQRQIAGVKPIKTDARFWWNKYLSEELLSSGAVDFVSPVIYGYFKSHSAFFNGGQLLEFALLTRRSWLRAGTRYFRRGVDEEGNVANFNETEQIFTTSNNQIYSFLQTRGSVPVYWSEINNLKYKPNLVLSSRPAQEATAKHFKEQVELYGDNYLVNLVNQSGYEQPIKDAYGKAVETLPESIAEHVKYIYFDFHHECRRMRWDRVKLLIEHLIELGFTSDNYFHFDLTANNVKNLQNKVVRTNCMDCLDRTNVVQSMLGRWVLQSQMEDSHYLSRDNTTPWEIIDPQFNLFFQSFWADNADAVSCAYSGTGALKTDYTRTGKRTKLGVLNDGINSVTRYYLNNYKDGYRQDSYDLFLGNYRPFQDSISNPFIDRRSPYIQLLPYLIGASFLVLVALVMYPSGSLFSWKNLIFVGTCVYFGFRNTSYVFKNGYQFVNWPLLMPLDYLKKSDVFNLDGKFVGIRYDEHENFKTSKKRN